MLSAIVQKVTNQKVYDYLTPRLFEPLGIEGIDWETDPKSINTGGWGLRLKTEDMAKFGQLFLQNGKLSCLNRKLINENRIDDQPADGKESECRPVRGCDQRQGRGHPVNEYGNHDGNGQGNHRGEMGAHVPERE